MTRITYRQQLALRQALASYRFAVAMFSKAGIEPPPEVADWARQLGKERFKVLVRCTICRDSFPKTVALGAGTAELSICPDCAAEVDAMERETKA